MQMGKVFCQMDTFMTPLSGIQIDTTEWDSDCCQDCGEIIYNKG